MGIWLQQAFHIHMQGIVVKLQPNLYDVQTRALHVTRDMLNLAGIAP